MDDMNYCYLCGNKFDDTCVKQHDEHIIQNAIGGVLTVSNILCEKCGAILGKYADNEFVKIFSTISDLLGIRVQRKTKKNRLDYQVNSIILRLNLT